MTRIPPGTKRNERRLGSCCQSRITAALRTAIPVLAIVASVVFCSLELTEAARPAFESSGPSRTQNAWGHNADHISQSIFEIKQQENDDQKNQ